jgi:carnitine 3-dehydrogenase
MTFHLAGGPRGMTHTLDLASDAFEAWWASLGTPHLTPDVRAKLVSAAAQMENGRSTQEWINWRDEKLVTLLQLLQQPPHYGAEP